MTRRPDETTEAYHARLAAGDNGKPRLLSYQGLIAVLATMRAALSDHAARHDITDYQFMMGLDPLTAKTVTPDQPQAVPDERLWWFLHVLDACGRHGTHANDEPGEWVAAFCGDVEPKDTFNRACDLKLAGWSHNTMDETCRVWITDAGKAWLAARPVLPVETPAEGLRKAWPTAAQDCEALRLAQDAHQRVAIARSDAQAIAIIQVAILQGMGWQRVSTTAAPLSGRDESLREALSEAFVAGATAVHEDIKASHPDAVPRGDPEFSEAARDYADAALAAVPPETAEMEGR